MVTVQVHDDRLSIHHAGAEVARHGVVAGRRQRVVEPAHLAGIIGSASGRCPPAPASPSPASPPEPAPTLLRPLAAYEQAIGGGW